MSVRAVISLKTVLVNKINYLINENFSRNDQENETELDFSCTINRNSEAKKAEILLGCAINKESYDQKPYMLEVEMRGLFSYDFGLTEEEIEKMLTTNAVAIVFPYLRATVSTITVNCGINPIILPTINVAKLLKKISK